MNLVTDPATGLDAIDFDGQKRLLASFPSKGKMQAFPAFEASGWPVFSPSDFVEVDTFPDFNTIYDQGNHGSCVGQGWAGAFMRAIYFATGRKVLLSPAYLYSLINGNQDQGAIISDGVDALINHGTCLFSTVGQNPIFQSQMPAQAKAEAQRFKLKAAFYPSTWAACLSALMMPKRMFIVYGYQVGNNFMHPDKYGVMGHDRGPGNHCNFASGVKKLPDGRWVLKDVNSWGTNFGPWQDGTCYIDEQHLFGGGDQPDVCAIECFADDPLDPSKPPVYQP